MTLRKTSFTDDIANAGSNKTGDQAKKSILSNSSHKLNFIQRTANVNNFCGITFMTLLDFI